MSTELPDYPLEVKDAKTAEDNASHLLKHNINVNEIADYVNQLRNYIEEAVSTETSGTTPSQVRSIIDTEKVEILIPVYWPSSVLPLMSSYDGTMTRSNNSDGSCTVTVTNVKNSAKIIERIRSYAGETVYPNVSITKSFIIITFDRREDLDTSPGYTGDSVADPNVKRLTII